jgi:hypothetical protein
MLQSKMQTRYNSVRQCNEKPMSILGKDFVEFSSKLNDSTIRVNSISSDNWYIKIIFKKTIPTVTIQLLNTNTKEISRITKAVRHSETIILNNAGNYFTGNLLLRITSQFVDCIPTVVNVINANFGEWNVFRVEHDEQVIIPSEVTSDGVLLFNGAQIVSLPMNGTVTIFGDIDVPQDTRVLLATLENGKWYRQPMSTKFKHITRSRNFYIVVASDQVGCQTNVTIMSN